MANKRKKPGPKPFPAHLLKSHAYLVRVTPNEKRMLDAEAKRQGISVAALLMRPWRGKE